MSLFDEDDERAVHVSADRLSALFEAGSGGTSHPAELFASDEFDQTGPPATAYHKRASSELIRHESSHLAARRPLHKRASSLRALLDSDSSNPAASGSGASTAHQAAQTTNRQFRLFSEDMQDADGSSIGRVLRDSAADFDPAGTVRASVPVREIAEHVWRAFEASKFFPRLNARVEEFCAEEMARCCRPLARSKSSSPAVSSSTPPSCSGIASPSRSPEELSDAFTRPSREADAAAHRILDFLEECVDACRTCSVFLTPPPWWVRHGLDHGRLANQPRSAKLSASSIGDSTVRSISPGASLGGLSAEAPAAVRPPSLPHDSRPVEMTARSSTSAAASGATPPPTGSVSDALHALRRASAAKSASGSPVAAPLSQVAPGSDPLSAAMLPSTAAAAPGSTAPRRRSRSNSLTQRMLNAPGRKRAGSISAQAPITSASTAASSPGVNSWLPGTVPRKISRTSSDARRMSMGGGSGSKLSHITVDQALSGGGGGGTGGGARRTERTASDPQRVYKPPQEVLVFARNKLEGIVMTHLHDALLGGASEDQAADEAFEIRRASLQWLTSEQLQLPPEADNDVILSMAQSELAKINSVVTPEEKMQCVFTAAGVLFKALNMMVRAKNASKGASADDFLPVFIAVVLRARVPRLESNCRFIERFRHSSAMLAKGGYTFVNLRSAMMFLMQCNAEDVGVSQEDWDSHFTA